MTGEPAFICRECRRITYSPENAAEGYCPVCKAFTRDLYEWLDAIGVELAAGDLTPEKYESERRHYRKLYLKGR